MTTSTKAVAERLVSEYLKLYPAEAARHLSNLPNDRIAEHLKAAPATSAAAVFCHLDSEVGAEIAAGADNKLFEKLFTEIDPAVGVSILSRLDAHVLESQFKALPPQVADEYRELLSYPENSAGRLMDPKVTTFRSNDTVEAALKRMRSISGRRIIDVCVVNEDRNLIGVVPLQVLALAEPGESIGNLISGPPASVVILSPREEVAELLEDRRLASLPVVNYQNRLMGIIRHDALISVAQKDATEDIQVMFGAGRDEQALSKASYAIKRRLPWLEINLATAFLAAFVVGLFEDTIARLTALAVFLPVVAGQSGNTGAQSLSVTMRGLALREVRTRHWLQILRKELAVGLVNGVLIAITTALIALVWMKSLGLAAVIGLAMIISMIIAGVSGAAIPIVLKLVGQDPALSSSIILTTVTDVVGFVSFLGLATLLAGALNLV